MSAHWHATAIMSTLKDGAPYPKGTREYIPSQPYTSVEDAREKVRGILEAFRDSPVKSRDWTPVPWAAAVDHWDAGAESAGAALPWGRVDYTVTSCNDPTGGCYQVRLELPGAPPVVLTAEA